MNGTRFYFKTTSKIVLTLLSSAKKLRELDLTSVITIYCFVTKQTYSLAENGENLISARGG